MTSLTIGMFVPFSLSRQSASGATTTSSSSPPSKLDPPAALQPDGGCADGGLADVDAAVADRERGVGLADGRVDPLPADLADDVAQHRHLEQLALDDLHLPGPAMDVLRSSGSSEPPTSRFANPRPLSFWSRLLGDDVGAADLLEVDLAQRSLALVARGFDGVERGAGRDRSAEHVGVERADVELPVAEQRVAADVRQRDPLARQREVPASLEIIRSISGLRLPSGLRGASRSSIHAPPTRNGPAGFSAATILVSGRGYAVTGLLELDRAVDVGDADRCAGSSSSDSLALLSSQRSLP